MIEDPSLEGCSNRRWGKGNSANIPNPGCGEPAFKSIEASEAEDNGGGANRGVEPVESSLFSLTDRKQEIAFRRRLESHFRWRKAAHRDRATDDLRAAHAGQPAGVARRFASLRSREGKRHRAISCRSRCLDSSYEIAT